MKDRLAKQEMMFAKYASHELKNRRKSGVIGAAELQAMKPDDPVFQASLFWQERILGAANGMKVLLVRCCFVSIVKKKKNSVFNGQNTYSD